MSAEQTENPDNAKLCLWAYLLAGAAVVASLFLPLPSPAIHSLAPKPAATDEPSGYHNLTPWHESNQAINPKN